jgi:ribokinase
MAKKIIVVGSSNTDMILKTKWIPKPGETIIGGKFSTAAGGKGANQAVGAARAGGQVTFVAKVGNDVFGRQAVEGFLKDGINIKYVLKDDKEPSGVALIFVADDGENSIGVGSGANAKLSVADVKKLKEVILSGDILLTQLETPLPTVKAAVSIANKGGVKVILNPAPAVKLGNDILKNVTILTPNETEIEILTGITIKNQNDARKAAEILQKKGVKIIIITLGSKGAYVCCDEFEGMVEGFKAKAVDTTAAGDVFNGALAVAISEKMPLADAVRFANAAAAISVTRLGAQPSVPQRKEIEKLLKTKK